jgi:uncharacterized protein (DUF1697 family)
VLARNFANILEGKFMPNYVAFLRAINVSGRYIKMPALAEYFTAIGYQGVQTFINTGNVLFDSTSESSSELADHIEINIAPMLGFKAEVFVRSHHDIKDILATAAALSPKVPSAGELNVAFLSAPLTEAQEQSLAALSSAVDEFVVSGSELYWLCQVAQNASKFSNGVMERNLKLRSTLRRVTMLEKVAEQFLA